jgi:hypothetical protein
MTPHQKRVDRRLDCISNIVTDTYYFHAEDGLAHDDVSRISSYDAQEMGRVGIKVSRKNQSCP